MKFKRICAIGLCVLLAVQSVQADAAIANESSTSKPVVKAVDYVNRDGGYTAAEEKEYNDTKTTIITTREEITDPAPDPTTHEVIGEADIVFAIDSTGSMYPYINNVQNNVELFASYLEEKGFQRGWLLWSTAILPVTAKRARKSIWWTEPHGIRRRQS